ncbi:hypothetical protein ORM80_23875 [Bacillus cereus]|uniref:hypothetical protein n=1 Tax=Bacillus cereus group TaxID=86661 RepID=UPI0007F945B5|nr:MULTISPECIES: hypothetical protein [Bacillus cereus group]ARV96313.1 hypothetical protein BJG91_28425 [Bacillus thuringiensis]MDZ4570842.1 hypothetical protein [Bacillus cereus]MDZ4637676.1 hypothetical protein [Bacillus cereus]MEB9656402.1 hypothetical protein [Bacillus cereus]OTY27535.1 hypothetical protein BK738_12395 [Bacillus thuringiensis serovar rongseni]
MKKSLDFNKKAFAHYMALYPVNEIRVHVIGLVLLGADVFVLLPAFANPFRLLYVYIVTPPVIFLNLWAILIAINPRKRQLQYTLFRGVYGAICSVGLLVITQKFAYGMLGLQTPIYFIFSVGLYIFALNYYYKNHIKKLQGSIKKSKSSKKNSGFGVLAFVGLGQLIANISLGFATQKMVAIVLMCVYSMLSFMLFHFIMELHRYYYLRKHIEDGGRTHETF